MNTVHSGATGAVAVVTHPCFELHDTGPHHPESPSRVSTVSGRLRAQTKVALHWVDAEIAPRADVVAVHSSEYLDFLDVANDRGGGMLDADTVMSARSLEAAYLAAGAALQVAEFAMAGTPAFAAVRPPGHHACRDRAMGFCLLNNVAVAVQAMLTRHELDRVLIVDWDVHHGNGTQDIVQNHPNIRYVSIHQSPHYPGTGLESERGTGNIFNVPLPPGLPPATYVGELLDAVGRATDGWQPDLLLVSAGFDSMRGDPLGGFTLEPEDFGSLTRSLQELDCPMGSVLEGGYAPARVAEGVLAHVAAMASRR